MDAIEPKLFSAQLRTDLPTLDLHGNFPSEVREILGLFISRVLEKNEMAARVIFGGGTGALRTAVLECLQNQKTPVKIYDEGGSVLILIL